MFSAIRAPLDESTLTAAEMRNLIDALLLVPTILVDARREVLVEIIQKSSQIGGRIPHSPIARDHAWNLWRTCSEKQYLGSFFEQLEVLDGGTEVFLNLWSLTEEYASRASVREKVRGAFEYLLDKIQSVSDWQNIETGVRNRIRLPVGKDFGPADQSLSDFLRSLCPHEIDSMNSAGDIGLLYTFVAALLSDLFKPPAGEAALEDTMAILESAVLRLGISTADLNNLRATAHGNLATAEPAFLVVIEPENPRQDTQQYTLSITKWLPYTMDDSKTRQAQGHCVPLLQPTRFTEWEHLKQKLIESLVWILRENDTPLIEFLVPIWLLCEPFETIVVDKEGEDSLFGPNPRPLMYNAQVVVRLWERTQTTHKPLPEILLTQWQYRWKVFSDRMNTATQPLTTWADNSEDALIELKLPANSEACCLGANFIPACPERGRELARILIEAGMPIAIWLREKPQGEPEEIAKALKLIFQNSPQDIRTQVRTLRLLALKPQNKDKGPIGASIALLWDDPRRLPPAAPTEKI